MSSADGPDGPRDQRTEEVPASKGARETIELQLFESLIHHLIEKGVLTKNDALSVVQTVAEVKRGELEAEGSDPAAIRTDLLILERLYSSFELIRMRPVAEQAMDGDNVLQLRPPLHGDKPKFPKED